MHVAIIPDGNRRWARSHQLQLNTGHEQGVKTFLAIVDRALELNIQWLTIWGASISNFEKRSGVELEILRNIFSRGFQQTLETTDVSKKQIRVRVIGEWERYLDNTTQKRMRDIMQATASYTRFNLTLLIAYDGGKDTVQAIQAISTLAGKEQKINVTPSLIKEYLSTKDLPDVDLLIRTGGDPHLSNGFMMWETQNSQLAFPSCWWPDFTADSFERTIEEFQTRERRFGA